MVLVVGSVLISGKGGASPAALPLKGWQPAGPAALPNYMISTRVGPVPDFKDPLT